MIILAFDTCLDKMYATLMRDNEILASEIVENTDSKYHSAFLISTLQTIMSRNNISPKDIDLIATNIGPGSFTGIRACVTVARVMAQQLNCRAIGVSSLEIIANTNIGQKPVLVALDARKNMAYLWHEEKVKGAVGLDEVKKIIETGDYNIITDDKLQPILGGISYQHENLPLGEILAKLAVDKIKNMTGNWGELMPLYIQPPPVGI